MFKLGGEGAGWGPEEMATFISEAIQFYGTEEDVDIIVETFREAGVLTNNKGLVIHVDGRRGPVFQVTVVRSGR